MPPRVRRADASGRGAFRRRGLAGPRPGDPGAALALLPPARRAGGQAGTAVAHPRDPLDRDPAPLSRRDRGPPGRGGRRDLLQLGHPPSPGHRRGRRVLGISRPRIAPAPRRRRGSDRVGRWTRSAGRGGQPSARVVRLAPRLAERRWPQGGGAADLDGASRRWRESAGVVPGRVRPAAAGLLGGPVCRRGHPGPDRDRARPVAGRGPGHRPIERRDDVLVYTSAPLTDTLVIAGPTWVTLTAATDGRDTDFTAKLLDVHPDGRALKLGPTEVGVIRARYRHGRERTALLEPGAIESYRIELFDIGHAFLPGHRIRLEIASSAFPFIDANSNTGDPPATDTGWRVARQTVYHDRTRMSFVELPVWPR
ncbi:MAG: CocE/NonD family hydrolase [Gemmatimonadetes bacterium]|nr:CocE/NonD family hydrolase [Gemmatimonadota bacterium]